MRAPSQGRVRGQRLLGGAYFEHLRSANGALALSRGTAILHRDLHSVLNLTLGLAFHTVRFRSHGNLLLIGPIKGVGTARLFPEP